VISPATTTANETTRNANRSQNFKQMKTKNYL